MLSAGGRKREKGYKGFERRKKGLTSTDGEANKWILKAKERRGSWSPDTRQRRTILFKARQQQSVVGIGQQHFHQMSTPNPIPRAPKTYTCTRITTVTLLLSAPISTYFMNPACIPTRTFWQKGKSCPAADGQKSFASICTTAAFTVKFLL